MPIEESGIVKSFNLKIAAAMAAIISLMPVTAASAAPSGGFTPVASFILDCNEHEMNTVGKSPNQQLVSSDVTSAYACIWTRDHYKPFEMMPSLVDNPKALVGLLDSAKRSPLRRCLGSSMERYGFILRLSNGKFASVHMQCGAIHGSNSSLGFALGSPANAAVRAIAKAAVKEHPNPMTVTEQPKVPALNCPSKLGIEQGKNASTRLLPHSVVAAQFCSYNHRDHDQMKQVGVATPRRFANWLNRVARTPDSVHVSAAICTADLWSVDYMIQFTLTDGSGVTADLSCHNSISSSYSRGRYVLDGSGAGLVARMERAFAKAAN
ncbi:MAG: hypothetical protein ACKOWK_03110 [Micrococcales bacterium]